MPARARRACGEAGAAARRAGFAVAHRRRGLWLSTAREIRLSSITHEFSAAPVDATRRLRRPKAACAVTNSRHRSSASLSATSPGAREAEELRELPAAPTRSRDQGPRHSRGRGSGRGFKLAAEGNYAGALPLLERAAASAPVRTAAERIARATTENTLGGALKNLGRFEEAAAVFERALAAFEGEAHDAARVEAAVVTNNLGAVRAELGRADEAEALYEAALRVFADPELPATGARRADALNNLADLRHSQGDLEEAERLYADALARREAALGAEHPETAASVNNLAVLLLELRRHSEALPLLRRAANIARATAGAAPSHYATALGKLASGLQLLGKAAEARTRFARALKINAAALGDDHPSTNTRGRRWKRSVEVSADTYENG